MLRFKLENVMRDEQFATTVSGHPIVSDQQRIRFAANGRDTRVHTVTLGPYHIFEIALRPNQLRMGKNHLKVQPTRLWPELKTTIEFREIKLIVNYT